MKRTLVIHGAFGQKALAREVRDWSRTVVVEVDARLPEKLRRQGAEIISGPLLPSDAREATMRRAQELLDAFLDDRAPVAGLNTTREFRSACLSLTGMRLLIPYVRTLLEAAEIMKRGPWERIVISPGAGVCTSAWEKVGRHFDVPVKVLGMDRQQPPALWMMKRRFQRWRLKRQAGQAGRPRPFQLPEARAGDAHLCVDPRLMPILGEAGAKAGWRAAPRLGGAAPEALAPLRQRYQDWWQGWWDVWTAENAKAGGLSDHEGIRSVGDWMSEHVYAKHAAALDQARAHLAELRPQRILLGSVLGMLELMWVLAARELGIQVVAYTLDDPIDPKLCFTPDVLLVDDLKHEWVARERGLGDRLVHVRTHRPMPKPVTANRAAQAGSRPQIVLAASFYLGHTLMVPSETILWTSELVVEAARQMPEADFAIKFHPIRERPDPRFYLDGFHHLHLWQAEMHFQSLRPPANARLIMPEVRLSELLPTTSILLHLNSYASLEACSAEVPVICLSPTADYCGINLQIMEQHGALKLARNASELATEIRRLLGNGSARTEQIEIQKHFMARQYPEEAAGLVEALARDAI